MVLPDEAKTTHFWHLELNRANPQLCVAFVKKKLILVWKWPCIYMYKSRTATTATGLS